MAKLFFRYGAMGSSKTANALMVKYNYAERGQKCLLTKPKLDSRDGENFVVSRAGLKEKCVYFEDITDEMIALYDCIVIDEAQFLTKSQVERAIYWVDYLGKPVVAYGLRADFMGNLFEGSMWLLAWADNIEEIKTICWCGKKATWNARYDEQGNVAYEGEQVVLGSNDKYTALCRKHWKEGKLS